MRRNVKRITNEGNDVKNVTKSTSHDFSASIQQQAVDKLLDSTHYPLVAVDKREDFPGCDKVAAELGQIVYKYSKVESKALLKEAVSAIKSDKLSANSLSSALYSEAAAIIEQCKRASIAAKEAGKEYEGPDPKEYDAVVNGGVVGLIDTLSDVEFYAVCTRLKVTIRKRPQIKLSSPRIDLSGIKLEILATGELWAKYKWPNCYRWCTKWEWVKKCKSVASITVSPEIRAKAHCTLSTQGARVLAKAKFDELRLDYHILDKIPLEGLANSALDGKPVVIYDASKLIAAVPVFQSSFGIKSISLPSDPSGLTVAVEIAEI